jgi:hypothetical protein
VRIRLLAACAALLFVTATVLLMRQLASAPGELVQAADAEADWKVTRANSAHKAFVVEVEAEHLERARQIADEIVDPVRSKGYEEILIYIRPLGQPDGPTRRFQWTPGGGFTESGY